MPFNLSTRAVSVTLAIFPILVLAGCRQQITSPTRTEVTVEATAVPPTSTSTPQPTDTPAPTALIPTSLPTATPTPAPTEVPTATPEPAQESEVASSVFYSEEELINMGYSPDYSETGKIYPDTIEVIDRGNVKHIEVYKWRTGSVEFTVPRNHVNSETILPMTQYENALTTLSDFGNLVHFLNLARLGHIPGIDMEQQSLPKNWKGQLNTFIQENPDFKYTLEGELPHPTKPNTYITEEIGLVNPSLPVNVTYLPLSGIHWDNRNAPSSERIYGGDPRTPYGLPYSSEQGYFNVKIENGKLTFLASQYGIDEPLGPHYGADLYFILGTSSGPSIMRSRSAGFFVISRKLYFYSLEDYYETPYENINSADDVVPYADYRTPTPIELG